MCCIEDRRFSGVSLVGPAFRLLLRISLVGSRLLALLILALLGISLYEAFVFRYSFLPLPLLNNLLSDFKSPGIAFQDSIAPAFSSEVSPRSLTLLSRGSLLLRAFLLGLLFHDYITYLSSSLDLFRCPPISIPQRRSASYLSLPPKLDNANSTSFQKQFFRSCVHEVLINFSGCRDMPYPIAFPYRVLASVKKPKRRMYN